MVAFPTNDREVDAEFRKPVGGRGRPVIGSSHELDALNKQMAQSNFERILKESTELTQEQRVALKDWYDTEEGKNASSKELNARIETAISETNQLRKELEQARFIIEVQESKILTNGQKNELKAWYRSEDGKKASVGEFRTKMQDAKYATEVRKEIIESPEGREGEARR